MSGSCVRARLLLLASMIAGLLIVPTTADAAYNFGTNITPIGSYETVFDRSEPPAPQTFWCGDEHFFQDAGTRAVRDASGRVALIMSHAGTRKANGQDTSGAHTRRIIGSGGNLQDPASFTVECPVIHTSHKNTNPAAFDRWEWLVSPFTEDGQTFHALVHNEYHGWEHAGQCPDPPPPPEFPAQCWYNQITLAKSTNRGDLYTHATAPNHLVATHPYQYNSGPPISKGYFQPTNIVKKDGWYYALFRAEAFMAQTRGTCVMRSDNLEDPDSWRAWDGDANDPQGGFTVDFVDPYAEAGTFVPAEHVCAPVSDARALANNLVYSRHFKRYMLIDQSFIGVDGGPGVDGVFYSLSDDLIHWDAPKLLVDAPAAYSRACTNPNLGIRVPTLIDPDSSDRNFNTIGQTAHLYFTQSQDCPETLNRDLVRIKIRFDAKPAGDRLATFEAGQIGDPETGFDTSWNGTPGQSEIDSAFPAYEGSKSAKLTSLGGNTGPWGSFNVSWPNGKDVWYGSAFFLQNAFAAANDRVAIMRWHNSTAVPPSPSRYGGIVLGTDDRYRLVRGVTGGSEDTIGPSFTIPEGRWVWLEVHQKLESNPSNAPFSEVYVDGRPVTDANGIIGSTAVNAYDNSTGVPNRIQYGYADRSQGNATLMWIDRSSVSLNQRGPIGPSTPGSFSGSEQDGFVTMYWLGTRPPGGGFRVYKWNPDTGAWSPRFNTTSNGTFETVANCKRWKYRVAAYDAQGRESVPTEPLELMPRPSGGCPPGS